jgi:hypothetical protein
MCYIFQLDLVPNQRKLHVNIQKTAVFLCHQEKKIRTEFWKKSRSDVGMFVKVFATVQSNNMNQQKCIFVQLIF